MAKKLKPVIVAHELRIQEIYYDVSILISKSGEAQLIDNSVEDYKDYVDCDTAQIKHIKIKK